MTTIVATRQDIPKCDDEKLKMMCIGSYNERMVTLAKIYQEFTEKGFIMTGKVTGDGTSPQGGVQYIREAFLHPELASCSGSPQRWQEWEITVEAYKMKDLEAQSHQIFQYGVIADRHVCRLKDMYAHNNGELGSVWAVDDGPKLSTHIFIWRKKNVTDPPLDESKNEKFGIVGQVLFLNCEDEQVELSVSLLSRGFFLARPWAFMKKIGNNLVPIVDDLGESANQVDQTLSNFSLDDIIKSEAIDVACSRVLDFHANTPDKFGVAVPIHVLK